MIATLLGLTLSVQARPAAPATPPVLEIERKGASFLSAEAIIRTPERFNEREEAAWKVLESALLRGTKELTFEQLMGYGSLTGTLPSAQAMDDWMRIRFVVPANEFDLAGQLLESVLTKADLTDEAIDRVRTGLAARPMDPWLNALRPSQPRFSVLRNRDVRELYGRVFRPENVRFVVSGDFKPGTAQASFDARFSTWKPKRVERSAWTDTKPTSTRPGPISSFEFTGPVLKPSDSKTPATLLAVFSLGVGKEGAMYRVLRGQMKLSYRQDAILWPTSKGWQPRLILLRIAKPEDVELAGKMREALLADVKTWTADELIRARAMAQASLFRAMPYSPFWLSAYGPEVQREDFAATWAAYNALTGSPWSTPELLWSTLESVELDGLQKAATELLEQANVLWIRGSTAP